MPRNLLILRINDKLPAAEVADPSVPRQDVPEGPVDILEVGGYSGISSLRVATLFWPKYRGGQQADLIVADVHFDWDITSPLSRLVHEYGNHLPTGLSHLKPFLAGAHSDKRLQAVGIHTADASMWETLVNSEQPLDRCMSLYAAHEIGEVAAIYDGVSLVEEAMRLKSLKPYWDWLERNARASFDGALRLALRRYRKRLLALAAPAEEGELPGIFVAPADYHRVLNWCEAMRREPKVLDEDTDCGLTFFYPDGSSDCLYIASLFAEVEGISWRALPAKCFDTAAEDDADVDPAELNVAKLPRVGKFLQKLGNLSAAWNAAADILDRHFPCAPGDLENITTPLTRIEISEGPMPLVRGLAVVFQLIRLQERQFAIWEDKFANSVWEPREAIFREEYNPALTLEAAANQLLKLIHQVVRYEEDPSRRHPFYRDQVFMLEARDRRTGRAELRPAEWLRGFTQKDNNQEWVKFIFRLLIADGILKPAQDDGYYLISNKRKVRAPTIPESFPGRKSVARVLGVPERSQWLRASLGFDAEDANSVERILCDAFVQHDDKLSRTKRGNEFRKRLENGQGPPWLLKICRIYASQVLHRENRDALPKWLYPNL